MNIGDYSTDRIVQQYGLAVSHLDNEDFLRVVGNQGITDKGCLGLIGAMPFGIFGQHQYNRAVILVGKNKVLLSQAARNQHPVPAHMVFFVPCPETDIQAPVRARAMAAIPGKHAVLDIGKPHQIRKLQKPDTVSLY
jgi:hypothetical protein